jgi:hypothetical protein
MPYMTRLVTITNYDSITTELRPFVDFQAAQKKQELTPDTKIALLQVENIPSYHVVFLESGIPFDDVLKELESHELTLSEDTKRAIKQAMIN